MPEILPGLEVPDDELTFNTARGGGPGGQNVNKVETKVTLEWLPASSRALDKAQKQLVFDHLASRITKAGVLRVTSQRHRTQESNRRAAVERFADLLRDALTPEAERVPTRVPKRTKRRRLRNKRHRSSIKEQRGEVTDWE
jgi:ribosome-associated protein